MPDLPDFVVYLLLFISFVLGVAVLAMVVYAGVYRKVGPEEALVRSGIGGLRAVTGNGIPVIPRFQQIELMDLSVKRIEISRKGEQGLICKDNMRADIEVAFFVRVNNTPEDILQVAQSLGCRRASERQALIELFDAKFSEALKTVGKHFDFVELYQERDKFKEEILKVIGTDLNGYVLDDCAIDYLEQTPLEKLDKQNILDAEGIKKITDLTAKEHILANDIRREKEKTITKQDVEAREAILALERQQAEAEEKQKREIAQITARENSETRQVQEQERLKAEQVRIQTDEELKVAEENRDRQILVAMRNKERTDGVEQERVKQARDLEAVERERMVTLAAIEKEKAVETERRNIQEVIRERVSVERSVVEEQERIKDTEHFADADRQKRVTVTQAEMQAQEELVKQVKAAEAAKQAAELRAAQVVVEAEAKREAAEKESHAVKTLASAKTADRAAEGLAEAHVQEAKAVSLQKQGEAEASVAEKKAVADAKGVQAMAVAKEKDGSAEASVLKLKLSSEAKGIEEKANAMKLLDGVGREHEEFKLRLEKDQTIEIAAIDAQRGIATDQAQIMGEALRSARIDIVGGDGTFFDQVINAVRGGKVVDRMVHNSETLTDVKNTFFNGNPEYFKDKLEQMIGQFNLTAEDIKDLSIAALIAKLMGMTDSQETKGELSRLLSLVKNLGVSEEKAAGLLNAT